MEISNTSVVLTKWAQEYFYLNLFDQSYHRLGETLMSDTGQISVWSNTKPKSPKLSFACD